MKTTQWTREESKERFPNSLSPLGWSVMQSALEINLESIKKEFCLKKLSANQVTRWVDGYLYSSHNFFRKIPLTHFAWIPLIGFGWKLVVHFLASLFSSAHGTSLKIRFLNRLYEKELSHKIQLLISEWTSQLPSHIQNFEDNKAASLTWNVSDVHFQKLLDKIERDGCAYNRLDFAIYFYKNILKSLIEKINTEQSNRIALLTGQSAFQIGKYISQTLAEAHSLSSTAQQIAFTQSRLGHLSLGWDIAQLTFAEQPALMSKMLSDPANRLISTPAYMAISPMEEQFIQLVSCDEQHRFYASYQFPYVRTLLKQINEQWLKRNILEKEDDFYCLTLSEVKQTHSRLVTAEPIDIETIQYKVKTRLSYLKPFARDVLNTEDMHAQEDIFYSSKNSYQPLDIENVQQWQGVKVSPGVAQGQAYWVTDYKNLADCPDQRIVLCETPSPNLHTAFIKAKAIVAETGGILSHGAIVARELQIPCILQVRNLKSIKNDDWIEVDAHFGIIKRLS
ncbi:MAG: hypothetical protein JNL11_06440 [Bdellovibrionaceae bacterium]|nr:hypothetical protein [Pseudobdellovibrionaceae bacterium]